MPERKGDNPARPDHSAVCNCDSCKNLRAAKMRLQKAKHTWDDKEPRRRGHR